MAMLNKRQIWNAFSCVQWLTIALSCFMEIKGFTSNFNIVGSKSKAFLSSSKHPSTNVINQHLKQSIFFSECKTIQKLSLHSNFALDVCHKIQKSVAVVTPVGVRNTTALGSGFIVDFSKYNPYDTIEDSHIFLITAAHVALPGHTIFIRFPLDNEGENMNTDSIPAKVIGRQTTSDLALLRINKKDLFKSSFSDVTSIISPLPIAQSKGHGKADVGSLAFACGFPSGILSSNGPALTMGIVCGMAPGLSSSNTGQSELNDKDLNLNIDGKKDDNTIRASSNTMFIVTDAAMAGGMSGGPLVNIDGEVIGMNSLVRSDLRALGNYAISDSTIESFLTRLGDLYFYQQQRKQNGQPLSETKPSRKNCNVTLVEGEFAEENNQNSFHTYRIVLYNDNYNKRERVAKILQETLDFETEKAEEIMMSAHQKGRAIIKEFIDNPIGDVSNLSNESSTGSNGMSARETAMSIYQILKKEDLLVEVEHI